MNCINNEDTPSILVLAHNNDKYIDRFLKYVTHNWKNPEINIAWSGNEKFNYKIDDYYIRNASISVYNYSKDTEFHVKILETLKIIKTKYIFLIGVDDFPLYSFAKEATNELNKYKNDICVGLKVTVDEDAKLKPYFCEAPTQNNLIDRCILSSLLIKITNKGFFGNWHFYGVHRREATIEAINDLPKNSKYSDSLESLLLLRLYTKKPWSFINKISSIHDAKIEKNKMLEEGGFSYWKTDVKTSINNTEIKLNLLNRFMSKDNAKMILNYKEGNLNLIRRRNLKFRNYLHNFIVISPFELKRKRNIYFYLKLIIPFIGYFLTSIFFIRYYKKFISFNKNQLYSLFIAWMAVGNFSLLKILYTNLYREKKELYDVVKIIKKK